MDRHKAANAVLKWKWVARKRRRALEKARTAMWEAAGEASEKLAAAMAETASVRRQLEETKAALERELSCHSVTLKA